MDYDWNQVKETEFNSDGVIEQWSEYEYDAKGKKTKRKDFSSDGEIKVWVEYEYDKNGNL